MDAFIRLVGPNSAVEVFGIRLVGVNAENGTKLLISIGFILLLWMVQRLVRFAAARAFRGRRDARAAFWVRQGIGLTSAMVLFLGLASIWFNDPRRLATGLGIITAALAIALQRVVIAVAGYFVILRGRTFNVGDRIVMGGVRGDVIALHITRTVIMEMGQPPAVASGADPAMWVQSRQYTGRIVTVSNARVFDEPVYNYTRDFPYIWEEIHVPVPYGADRARAEAILLAAAERHSQKVTALAGDALEELRRHYVVKPEGLDPHVYLQLTDNWLELTVRFLVEDRAIRPVKDAISREVLDAFERAGIPVASSTVEVVGMPTLKLQHANDREPDGHPPS